jgi:hypothetical protein
MAPGHHQHRVFAARPTLVTAASLLIGSLMACSEKTTPVAAPVSKEAGKIVQSTFASPEEAGAALLAAAQSSDPTALLAIFGPDGKDVVLSGDPVKDKDLRQNFVAAYGQMHRWREIKVGGEMLSVGADNFLFPIPLGKSDAGRWQFDTAAGKDEILARRIGHDEWVAIAACTAVAGAEAQYFKQAHDGEKIQQYAQRLVSDEGQQNGLYWPAAAGRPPSPLEAVRDFAKAAGYTSAGAAPQPFDGYYFRILTKQGSGARGGARDYIVGGKMTGGFAVLAYPVAYRDSGIMTFMVGMDGVVYQKDLGENTTDSARALTEYDPAQGWNPAT